MSSASRSTTRRRSTTGHTGAENYLHATRCVLDLSDELLDDVLQEEHTGRRTVLVEDPRQVHARTAHGREGVLQVGLTEDRDQLADALRRHRLVELARVLQVDDVLEVQVAARLTIVADQHVP